MTMLTFKRESEKGNENFADADIVVSAVGLTKVFRDFWNRPVASAVNDIDFEVRRGEVFGLLGPNGSGKSTTVKMLLGLLYPTAGRLTVFGKSPSAVETKRSIGYLPEETLLYKYLTAYETLDFFGALFGLSAAERRKRADQLLDMVGLAHARNRPVGEFSKGMARRIGLAQAMINDPEFLILDEPTSGLDPIGCREVKDLILALKKRGKTILVTSHLLSDMEEVCDRTVILYGGKIRAEGELSQILSVSDRDTLSLPHLSDEVKDELLSVLERHVAAEDIHLAHPHKSLEEFFLDIVAKAKAESTAGARQGSGIADYLKPEEEKGDRNAVLNDLLKETTAPQSEEIPKTVDAAKEQEEKHRAEVLASVEDEPVAVSKGKPTEPQKPAMDVEAANKRLSDLMNGKTGK